MTNASISLANLEGVHIGGELQELASFPAVARAPHPGIPSFDNNGHHMVGQMYAQYFWQAVPRSPVPLALWHGGGMTGACWENTPDNRAGWLNYFLREKFNVVLCDAFERGRASLPPFPHAVDEAPEFRSIDSVWHHFRFGPLGRFPKELSAPALRAHAYPGLQFPIEQLEQFGRQFAPRFTNTDALIFSAYEAFLKRTGPCTIVAHSQGAVFALQCALAMPHLVQSVVALEPPVSQFLLNKLSGADAGDLPPHLFIWGDFIREKNEIWSPWMANAKRYHEILAQRGVQSSSIELPSVGIFGNSHMLQMEANSQEIAAIVRDWIVNREERGLCADERTADSKSAGKRHSDD